jgi:hypothetical protein
MIMAEEQTQKPEPSERQKRRLERMERVKKASSRPRVRVVPTSEEKRNALRRLPDRIGFLDEGSVEWPNDTFTHNRIRDGDVTIEEPTQEQKAEREGRGRRRQEEPPPATTT